MTIMILIIIINLRRSKPFLPILIALALLGCSGGPEPQGEISIVATTPMLGDVVSNVVGDDATVSVLIPTGADPHSFAPSSRQVAELHEADLIVANGLGLEGGLADLLGDVEGPVLEVGPELDPIPFGGDHNGHSDDPHIWMDPLRMSDAARLIAGTLSDIDADVDWSVRADAYAGELEAAFHEIEEILSTIPAADRVLITNHDSIGYFADRFGFEVVGTVIPGGSTLADPGSGALADLVRLMRERGIGVVFAETTQPNALAEAVAAELGTEARVVELYTDSLGEPGSEADTLIGMLLTNARLIAGALGTGN